jgi:hypothetical protein
MPHYWSHLLLTERTPLLVREIERPYCNGTGGRWEFIIVKRNKKDMGNEIGESLKRKACRGLGRILNI